MKSKAWLWLICLLLLSGKLHAEGGCPPGEYPITGQGWQTCNPIPGYAQNQGQAAPQQPQPPPPMWATRWGAVATYEPNGSLGTSVNMTTQSSAESAALTNCESKHGSTCKIQLSYHNQCTAMSVSDKGYNVGSAATVAQAAQTSLKICRDSGDPNCRIYYTACSLPVRIQ
jgi:hypothetical protein